MAIRWIANTGTSLLGYLCADVVKLVDTLALGASTARCVGSSPIIRTILVSSICVFCYSNSNRRQVSHGIVVLDDLSSISAFEKVL